MYGDSMFNTIKIIRVLGMMFKSKTLLVMLLAGSFSVMASLPDAYASIPNRVYRIDIRPRQDYTRITVRLQNPPDYTLATLPGNRLRLIMQDTDGPLFKKFRRYSDTNIGGLVFSRRNENLLITFQVAQGVGWRKLQLEGISAITLDIGKPFKTVPPIPAIAGREKIWSGVEKLLRDFDPPLKPEIPFIPTDRQILKNILVDSDQQSFIAAEAALYKGPLSEAEEIFTQFAARQAPVRPLALYRLGETLYKLQKYPQALAAFREAERVWPAYLNFNHAATFYYGDSIARSGDLVAGRTLLGHLIANLTDKNYAPTLLVRMADILVRQGHDQEAVAVYRTVAENFKDNKASQMARLRLTDLDFFNTTPWNYRRLAESYQGIYQQASDQTIREESFFKNVLLESIHGEAPEALRQVVEFQKRFPRGMYATVCRTMREVLVSQVFRETGWDKDFSGLISFAEEHQDYLSGCIEQPDFLPKISKAYEEAGRPIEQIRLFNGLLDRQWASSAVPFLYEEIADKADLLGDTVLAEKTLHSFLRKYPVHPRARLMMERLGGIYFSGDKSQEVKDTLLWLLNKGEHAQKAESYYYLGRALWNLKAYAQSAKAMDLYVTSQAVNVGGEGARLLPDAYYVEASARESTGDSKGALRLLEAGIRLPVNAHNETLLYKAGELSLLNGKKQLARGYFEQVTKNGKDPDWRKLAQQALDSLQIAGSSGRSGN
jgi:TolA-binding protein